MEDTLAILEGVNGIIRVTTLLVNMEGDCAEITNFAGQKPHDK
jgi:hypothetical protein